MLLGAAKAAFDDAAWTYELKFDGYRLMSSAGRDGVFLKSRNGANATSWFPEVVKGLTELPPGEFVFDGEVCVLDEHGRSDFDRLHERALARGWRPGLASVVYCIFDVLVYRGRDVRGQPLKKRQAMLERVLSRGASSILRVTGFVGEGVWLFEQAKGLRLEGVVAKRLDSPYTSGERSQAWLKIKRKGAVPAQRFRRQANST